MCKQDRYNKIILTGYRGTGKTTVGKKLAARLQWNFLDMDDLLTQRLGASITEIVAIHGWEYFRQAEAKLLQELSGIQHTVIATGGGAIEHQQEWRQIRPHAFVIWLDATVQTIEQRLQADRRSVQLRPSLTAHTVSDEIRIVLKRRTPLYRAGSDLRLLTDKRTPDQLTEQIIKAIGMSSQPPVSGRTE